MRFASVSGVKATLLYGLLAVSQARPFSQDISERDLITERDILTIGPRGVPPLIPKPKTPPPGGPKPPPGRPDAPGQGPDAPPPLRPGQPARPAPGGDKAPPPRLGQEASAPLAGKGNRDLKTLEDNIAAGKVGNFDSYNAKISNYHTSNSDPAPLAMQIGTDTRKFFNGNGVDVGKNFMAQSKTKVTKVDIYGAKEKGSLESIWSGSVSSEAGLMTRSREFRSGEFNGKSIDDLYPNIPPKERIFTSEHIAKTWETHGQGKPLKKVAVLDIKNDDMAPYLKEVFNAKKGDKPEDGVTIGPNDPEWSTIMGGSAGNPLVKALADHPNLFHKHKPTSVKVMVDDGDVYAIFNLGP